MPLGIGAVPWLASHDNRGEYPEGIKRRSCREM